MLRRPSKLLKLILLVALCSLPAARPVRAAPAKDPCVLPAPALTYPAGGSTINSLVPMFQWNGTGTDVYYIQLSTTNDVSNLLVNGYVPYASGATVSYGWRQNLTAGTTYFWHVASICSDYHPGAYSPTATFQTGNISGPFINPPPLLTPAEGARFLIHATVYYSWGDSTTAKAYQLRVYKSMTDVQNDQIFESFSGDSWRTNAQDIQDATGTFYWRIKVRDDVAWGPYSPLRSFTVVEPQLIYLPLIRR